MNNHSECITLRDKIILEALKEAGYKNPKIDSIWGVVVDENLRDSKDWPLLWSILEQTGFLWGCGGTFYHQIAEHQTESDPYIVIRAFGWKCNMNTSNS